jgi:uncharacterized lipoprotein YmbA
MRFPQIEAISIVAASSLLSACASSPRVHFYTLDPVPSPHPTAGAFHGPVRVGAVYLPPALDRKQMVGQSAPNTLTISGQNRWGAPLTDMMRRVLTQDLMARLPPGAVVSPKAAAAPDTRAIALDILQFQPDPAGIVILEGSWTLSGSHSDPAGAAHSFKLQEPGVQKDYVSRAQAMSQLVGRLADAIAAALASPSTHPDAE